ncbi:amidase [Microbacterium sp. HM58-2]|nr:amidase [Microbacterium sp. HM58-2]
MAQETTRLTATEIRARISEGAASREEVVHEHLDRIDEFNALTNSFVELRADQVLEEARAADREFGSTLGGPLDGVPLSIKDSYSVAGLHRTDGLPVNADVLDAQDDVATARLRAAGGLVLGHAGIPDLCIRWNSVSGLYGAVRNPRDLSRTAGGSSGGDAANVAAGFATIGLGGDLGGSIRVPASWCGVYGFRTGPGRIPDVNPNGGRSRNVVMELMAQIGPIARSIDDIELAFRIMTGVDRRDTMSSPLGLIEPIEAPRVAVLRHETGAVLDSSVEEQLDATIEMLRAEGYVVEENVLPDLHRAPEVWAEIVGTELIHRVLPEVAELVIASERMHIVDMFGAYELGADVGAYLTALEERSSIQMTVAALMERYQLILAPVAGMPAPPLDFDDHIGREASIALFDQMRCVPWVNLLGLPSLALPNGIQLVGRKHDELTILAAGRAYERRAPRVEIATPAI